MSVQLQERELLEVAQPAATGGAPKQVVTPLSLPGSKQAPTYALELPASVWRGVVADYRDMLANTTEASDAYHLFTLLACVGSVMGRRYNLAS